MLECWQLNSKKLRSRVGKVDTGSPCWKIDDDDNDQGAMMTTTTDRGSPMYRNLCIASRESCAAAASAGINLALTMSDNSSAESERASGA
jgi:hypothetical protein